MSITDELREYSKSSDGVLYSAHQAILAIADRIDAEHERLCSRSRSNGYGDGFNDGFNDIESWVIDHENEMAEHGLVELPKDADNVPVCIGDRMEWVRYKDDDPTIVRKVSAVGAGVFFAWSDEQGRYAQYEAHAYRHHHAPTVEDVLREFAYGLGVPVADSYIAATAAKLRLAEGEDA